MNLIISLDVNDISLQLKDGRKIVGELAWSDEYTLSEMLLPNVDKLLRQSKVSKNQISKASAKISKGSGVTSTRIVQTVVKAWNAGSSFSAS
ncbi:MAG: hypothetical protein ACD_56C00123G0005 [uncultured bacterium]|nr:MAG: hypothetical protein ACD_56C00123G0005 [uncultured bacterium]